MLDDEIQRLSELFKRSGDKTGFVRLLESSDIKELFINLVSMTIENLGGKVILKCIHPDSLDVYCTHTNEELTHYRLSAIKELLANTNTDYVVCPNARVTQIASINDWLFGSEYNKKQLSNYNFIIIDAAGHILLTTIISKFDLDIAKEKAKVLREELKKLEALGA